MEPRNFFYLWSKYRPVILQLMSAAVNEPQQYKLYAHEFRAASPRQKTGYSFILEAFKGKAVNNIKDSALAKDLLQVLQQSGRASELMNEATYELSMDKDFVFHVNRKDSSKIE